jgi:hypothetical protein
VSCFKSSQSGIPRHFGTISGVLATNFQAENRQHSAAGESHVPRDGADAAQDSPSVLRARRVVQLVKRQVSKAGLQDGLWYVRRRQ